MCPRRMRIFSLSAVFFALGAVGCNVENEGIDPPADDLIYPVGLAMDPGGRYLYVANANFDLKYNGGTVVAIDLDLVESRQNVANIPADEVIEKGSSVRIGTFAADLALSPDGTRLFAPVRGDNSVTWIEVDEGGGRRLRCWDGNAGGDAPACSGGHVIGSGQNSLGLRLPSEPYGIAFEDTYAIVTHAGVGEVSLLADVPGRPELVDIQGDLPAAASGVGVHPLNGRVYVAHRGASALSTLDVFDGSTVDAVDADNRPALVPRRAVPVDVVASGADSRALVFHPDGHEVYVANRAPRSLLTLDTSIGADGAPLDEWRDAVPLGAGPSRLVVHTEPDGRVLVYAVCFDDAVVYAVDPARRTVDGILWTGEGPHGVAFDDTRAWIFVATFVTSTIEVYDGDPSHDSYRQLLFTIGVPKHPQGVDA